MIQGFGGERVEIVIQPARALKNHKGEQGTSDRHEAGSERIEMGNQHRQLNWFPTMERMANTNEAARNLVAIKAQARLAVSTTTTAMIRGQKFSEWYPRTNARVLHAKSPHGRSRTLQKIV